MIQQEPICALITPTGIGAIGVLRVSGAGSIELVNKVFFGKNLTEVATHTIHFGTIRESNSSDSVIDEVLVSVFRSPHSFTKEDTVEISCHGSAYIIREILRLLIQQGARYARAGEFTQRAFLNGQFDLVQAEAVADLIAADSEAAHRTAIHQLRGGFSQKLQSLREELIHFASMVELELDFGEEDVEFANRTDLEQLVTHLQTVIKPLIDSFQYGNALKEGIPVAIIGAPNVGKSTLLNALLNEEKAIVTPIAGTTRDVIEDTLIIGGIKYRIIDTAGIRHTEDLVESMGIERSKRAMNQADIVILMYDDDATLNQVESLAEELGEQKTLIWVRNKVDATPLISSQHEDEVNISAKTGHGIEDLKNKLSSYANNSLTNAQTTVTNLRHYEHLVKTQQALTDVSEGLKIGITGDFLAQDIRLALHHLGEITGTIATDDLLDNIFSKFCIGK